MSNQDTAERGTSGSSLFPTELERLRAEHAAVVRTLQEAVRDTTRLTRLFAVLNESAPVEVLLDRVLATLSELFLSDIAVLLGANGARGTSVLAGIGLPTKSGRPTAYDGLGSYAEEALTAHSPIVITRARSDPKVDATLRELEVEAAVWIPVAGDDGTRRGVLILGRCRPQPFVRADVDLLVAMAYRVGLLVERAHAEQNKKMLEARLRQAAKAESLDRMAAAVAHHFNNMLAVVVASLDLALEDLPESTSTRDDLIRAREATMHAAKTAELLLAYIGQNGSERETVDLIAVIREALASLRAAMPSHVRLVTELCDTALIASASPPQISQLLGHLLNNACEAIGPSSGEIHVTVSLSPGGKISETQPSSRDFHPDESTSYARIEVRDNGCGMSGDTLEKIFDPFFTTKFVGRGLGLPVVLGTVRAHDGHVFVESAVGQGTTVRVYLPLSRRLPQVFPSAPPASMASVNGPALALVAEDEDTLRRTTKRILGRMGYEVITTNDGIEALEQFRRHANDVRIVVLDLAMPRMDGWAALDAIRAIRPDIPVVLASGYDETHAFGGRSPYHSLVFLHKPYSVMDLRNAVERLVSETRARALAALSRKDD
ncbi:MAG TPA: ATP-binding protein [Polyangiaceae bacterium]|nr:ATP-binding protein [Polyangiaceae bacterium]